MMSRMMVLAFACPAVFALDAPVPVFEAQVIDDGIKIGYGVAVADMDGDGRSDVVVADKSEVVWYQNPLWQKHLIARQLTLMDNVCVAARDIDGDGRAEVAVGAQWNPGETVDAVKSGAVFYLQRPVGGDGGLWSPVKLTHEPTVHRMKWVRTGDGAFQLVVVPLHGRGNNPMTGEGAPVRVLAYDVPDDRSEAAGWTTTLVDESLNKTHNFEVRKLRSGAESLWIGGRQGVRQVTWVDGRWDGRMMEQPGLEEGVGEIRAAGTSIMALVQPMHGSRVVVYHDDSGVVVLDESLNQGHALVCQPLLGRGFPEVVAGWREPDADGRTGLKLYVRDDASGEEKWITHVLGPDTPMACEDLVAADLDDDGRTDLIASGRATHNVVVYWNKTDLGPAVTAERPFLPELTAEERTRLEERRRSREKLPANEAPESGE